MTCFDSRRIEASNLKLKIKNSKILYFDLFDYAQGHPE